MTEGAKAHREGEAGSPVPPRAAAVFRRTRIFLINVFGGPLRRAFSPISMTPEKNLEARLGPAMVTQVLLAPLAVPMVAMTVISFVSPVTVSMAVMAPVAMAMAVVALVPVAMAVMPVSLAVAVPVPVPVGPGMVLAIVAASPPTLCGILLT